MGMEIERKFLVKSDEWKKQVKTFHHLDQTYLAWATSEGAPEVRVRLSSAPYKGSDLSDDENRPHTMQYAFLTLKSKGHVSRKEVETAIDLDAAKDMMSMGLGNVVSKTRYLVPVDGLTFEIDVYHGDLDGLITAEVELEDENQLLPALPWLGEEVSELKSYKNASLAQNGLPAHQPLSPSFKV